MEKQRVVFLFDVDNTLLDNDRVTADLKKFLAREVGEEEQKHYFELFEELRHEVGYADYLGTLQMYRLLHPHDTAIMNVSLFMLGYHFANRLFPNSLDVIDHVKQFGTAAILSDGDVVFQPHKIENSGLWEAFDGNVLIYIHKEDELDAVEEFYPADHYVLVDDKLKILDAVKRVWGERVTTVFPKQGHYALDPKIIAAYPPADISLDRVGDLLDYDLDRLLAASKPAAPSPPKPSPESRPGEQSTTLAH